MKRAGIDIDGVLYDWDAAARDLLAVKWGVDGLVAPTSYFGVRDEQLRERLGRRTAELAWSWLFQKDAADLGLWSDGPTIPGAVAAVRRLSSTHEIHIITKRPRLAGRDTLRWLLNVGIVPDSVTILDPSDGKRTKSEVPCDWYVDDSPSVLADLDGRGCKAYAFDQGWNRDCTAGERVLGWDDLLRKVLKG